MKRYNMNAIGEAYPNALGLWSMYSDLQEWALRHKATLHEIETSPWDDCGCEVCQRSLASHAEALREIEELLK